MKNTTAYVKPIGGKSRDVGIGGINSLDPELTSAKMKEIYGRMTPRKISTKKIAQITHLMKIEPIAI